MEVRVLQYFLAVARAESISGAAALLHVSQPTLSRQIAGLEKELGTQLFIRGNRKIALTEDGMLLRSRAQEIVDLVAKAQAEIQAAEGAVSGDVYIGGGETRGMKLVAQAVESVRAQHPGIRFHFFSGNAEDVAERLDKGLLDFGVLIEPASLAKYDTVRLPCVDTWGLLMRKDSPLASRPAIRPQDLEGLPLLCSRQRLVSKEFTKWLDRDYEALNVVATYNLIYNASLLVEQGVGYALGLDGLLNTTGDSGLCFRPLQPRLEAGQHFVWKKYQVFSKSAEIFLQRMQTEFAIEQM